MGTSDAKKAADMRWQRKNMHNFTVKMPNREADALKAACQRRGITPHSIFLAAARALIAEEASGAGTEEASTGGDEATTGDEETGGT